MAMLYKSPKKKIQTFKHIFHLLDHGPHGRVSVSEKLGKICFKIEETPGNRREGVPAQHVYPVS